MIVLWRKGIRMGKREICRNVQDSEMVVVIMRKESRPVPRFLA